MPLTAEQELELVKMQSLNIAANALAQSANLIGVPIEVIHPMVTALAERKLKELKENNG